MGTVQQMTKIRGIDYNGTIDDLLRDLAKKGRINHITLSYAGTGKEGGHKFNAAFRDDKSQGYQMMSDPDPVIALLQVLLGTGYKFYPGNDKPEKTPDKKRRNLLDDEPAPTKRKRDLMGD